MPSFKNIWRFDKEIPMGDVKIPLGYLVSFLYVACISKTRLLGFRPLLKSWGKEEANCIS